MARMTAFVFWSGIYNAGLAVLLLFPSAYRSLGLNICDPLWGWLIASFLAFTSVVLILAARDLGRRASFVYWESFLRYAAALLAIPAVCSATPDCWPPAWVSATLPLASYTCSDCRAC